MTTEPISLVCISDTHGLHNHLTIPPCDILLHAGDFTPLHGFFEEAEDFVAWLAEQPAEHKVFTCGNHEVEIGKSLPLLRDLCEPHGIHLLINQGVTIKGLKVWGSPHSVVYGRGRAFMHSDLELIPAWAMIPDDTDILITHCPPFGIKDAVYPYGQHCGSATLLDRVQLIRPMLHVVGHIHEDPGQYLDTITGVLTVNASMVAKPIDIKTIRAPIQLRIVQINGQSVAVVQ